MAEKIKGTVEAYRTVDNGGWRKGVKIGDRWFRASKDYQGPPLDQHKGEQVEIEFKSSDNQGRTTLWAQKARLLQDGAGPGEFSVSSKDLGIMREVALKAAVDHCNAILALDDKQGLQPGSWVGANAVLAMATRFEEWLVRDLDEPPEPEEEPPPPEEMAE